MYYSNVMSKKYKILSGIILAILIYLAVSVFFMSEKTDHLTPSDDGRPDILHEGEEIAAEGEITCLALKETSVPAELSCALGIQEKDGRSFALKAEDSALIGSMRTGQNVEIVGLFIPDDQSKYDIIGTLDVTKVIEK